MKHFSQSVMLVVAFQPNKPSLDLFQYYVIYFNRQKSECKRVKIKVHSKKSIRTGYQSKELNMNLMGFTK